MKKHLKLTALLSALVLLLCACTNSESTHESSDPNGSSVTNTSQTDSGSSDISTDNDSSDTSNTSTPVPSGDPLPRMDGSTSAIPLEIGLRSGFLGISYTEAKEMVSHTTTHDSFKRLISGEVDLIFSVPISEDQRKAADDAGVKLFMEPVAREGFVFVVNANNPVDSLTSDQLRKIYSGEITNWSQVGGNNEPILPYQRNTDSGSQNYMTVFMGDTPLLEPQKEFTAIGMGGLMDAVAVYDNSAGAIGYSVYSYAAQMYANANKVKFIAVDGVVPSKATMADESYPLLSCTYLIYTDKSPESAKKFVERALSNEGQTYVLESGYLPVNGMEVPEKYLPYEAVGTGEPRPADFKPSDKCSQFQITMSDIPRYKSSPLIKGDKYFEFRKDLLKNTELLERINNDIRAAMDRLRLQGCKLPQDEIEFRSHNQHIYGECIDDISFYAVFRNGYLSITLGYTLDYSIDDLSYLEAETLNYDLFSGKKIEKYSDLFYNGEDFLPYVNEQFAKNASRLSGYPNVSTKLDFSGILGEPRLFTIDGIMLEPDNLYFNCAVLLEYDDEFNFLSSVTQYRDMKEIFTEEHASLSSDWDYGNEWKTEYIEEDGELYLRHTGSPFHTAAEVKARDELWYDMQKRFLKKIKEEIPEWRPESERAFYETDYCYDLSCFISMEVGYVRVQFDKKTLELIDFNIG
ncbi:MAG: PstS family phosphate ABC transporter substrate-binding protein [Oscillospiraceae bacterium]|nr:PstS family phosphate ABC transporter substrate-binding protein [Oscillospiraceae bacterium]